MKFCEPYMYSLFSVCEYLVVLLNVAFNAVVSMGMGSTVRLQLIHVHLSDVTESEPSTPLKPIKAE